MEWALRGAGLRGEGYPFVRDGIHSPVARRGADPANGVVEVYGLSRMQDGDPGAGAVQGTVESGPTWFSWASDYGDEAAWAVAALIALCFVLALLLRWERDPQWRSKRLQRRARGAAMTPGDDRASPPARRDGTATPPR